MLENGESIGRASSNNMVLQDEYRVISSRHAEVNLQGDQFVLVDLSSNGTFINSDAQSIGKGNVAPVNSGDLLIIGDYQFSVEVEAASASALPDGLGAVDFLDAPAPLADFKTEQSNSPSSPAPQTLSDSGGLDDFDHFFEPSQTPQQADPWNNISSGANSGVDPLASLEQKTSTDPLAAFEKPTLGSNVLSDAEEDKWWEESQIGPANSAAMPEIRVAPELTPPEPAPLAAPPIAPPIVAPSPAPPIVAAPTAVPMAAPAAAPAPVGVQSAEMASLLGLHGLTEEQTAAVVPSSAAIVNIAVENLVGLLQARASIKNELRASRTVIMTTGNNPLKFSAGAGDALQAMFATRSEAFVQPEKAVQEGFEDVADHQVAVLYAMKSAFNYMLSQFSPAKLESQLGSDRKGVLGNRKAKIWENYFGYFEELQKDQETSYDQLFGDAFAEAYEAKLEELKSTRRSNRQ